MNPEGPWTMSLFVSLSKFSTRKDGEVSVLMVTPELMDLPSMMPIQGKPPVWWIPIPTLSKVGLTTLMVFPAEMSIPTVFRWK